jgi:hypothetical protein
MTKDRTLKLLKRAISANLLARFHYAEATPNPDEEPVVMALQAQMKTLGKLLFDLLGSTSPMVDVATEIADDGPGGFQWRCNVIDKNWDGVGANGDIWTA